MALPALCNFEKNCLDLLKAAPSSHSRNCFRSALHHIERAEALLTIDPAMAMFRGITAEEEAASGLIRCLSELSYPYANALNPRDHVHKHAVFPYLEVLGLFFGQTVGPHFKNYHLHIQEVEGERRLTLAFDLTISGETKHAYPIPPLNFGVSIGKAGGNPDYAGQVAEFVAVHGAPSIKAFLKKEANVRNTILYAGPDGYPVVQELKESFLQERRRRVLAMVNIYLLIFPYKEHQPYVVQSITTFAALLAKLKKAQVKHDT